MSDHDDVRVHAPLHDGVHGMPTRHVHYELDTHSIASDEDMREVEVCRSYQDEATAREQAA